MINTVYKVVMFPFQDDDLIKVFDSAEEANDYAALKKIWYYWEVAENKGERTSTLMEVVKGD